MKIGSTSLLKLVEKEIIQEKLIIRHFCLTDTREALSKTISHFEYLIPISTNDQDGNGQCIPTVLTHSLFDFIGLINKRPQTNNQDQYITVHCGYVIKSTFLKYIKERASDLRQLSLANNEG
jgi:hypothetical protein